MRVEAKEHIAKYLQKNIRYDRRKKDEYRPVTLEYGPIKNAEGSARVKIGDTDVIVGVKMALGTPYPDSPDEGAMMVGAELLPMSNPEFELGPPGIQAIELARVVDRGIRESKTIDMKKLCIEKGEKVWLVEIDICSINDSGNLFDASALAAVAAIKSAVFPKLEDGKIDYKTKTKDKLPLQNEPVSVTVIKIGDNLIVDPILEEEELVDARLTAAVTTDGNLCAMQKGGDATLSAETIGRMIELAMKKSEELRKKL